MSAKTAILTLSKWIVITVLIVFAMMWGTLTLAQKAKDPIRLGMEDYLEEVTGGDAEITDMPKVELVPNVVFGMKGIVIRDRKNPETVLAKADMAFFAMPLLSMMAGTGKYLGLVIENLQIAGGFVFPKRIDIKNAGIADPDMKSTPQFLIEGTYDKKPLMITAEVRRQIKDYPLYSFDKLVPVTFKIGDLDGEGTLTRGFSSVTFEAVVIRHIDKGAVFIVKNIERNPLHADFEGKIEDIDFNAVLMKSGEDTVFRLTPGTNDPNAIKRMTDFVELVRGDLGLDGTDKTFKIEVVKKETGSTGDKEKKAP